MAIDVHSDLSNELVSISAGCWWEVGWLATTS